MAVHLHFHRPQAQETTDILFVSTNLPFLHISEKWRHTIHSLSQLPSFTSPCALAILPGCNTDRSLTAVYCQVTLDCVEMPLFSLFATWCTCGLLPVLGYYELMLLWTSTDKFLLLRIYPTGDVLSLTFEETARLPSWMASCVTSPTSTGDPISPPPQLHLVLCVLLTAPFLAGISLWF